MSVLKEGHSARQQHKMSNGNLRDYSLQHRVTINWNLNKEAKTEKIFQLQIDDYTVLLDWEEMQRYGRWI